MEHASSGASGEDGMTVQAVDARRELVVSAWSAVSPFGVETAQFVEGVAAGRIALSDVDAEHPGTYERAGIVPDFTVSGQLGKQGTRAMDRVTGIAVTAVGKVLEACGPGVTAEPERIGLVLGTGSGSVQSIMDFTKDSLTGE